jgi:hypothetical protein
MKRKSFAMEVDSKATFAKLADKRKAPKIRYEKAFITAETAGPGIHAS